MKLSFGLKCQVAFVLAAQLLTAAPEQEFSSPFVRVPDGFKTTPGSEIVCVNVPPPREQGPFGTCAICAAGLMLDSVLCEINAWDAAKLTKEQRCSIISLARFTNDRTGQGASIDIQGKLGTASTSWIISRILRGDYLVYPESELDYDKITRANEWRAEEKTGYDERFKNQKVWAASFDAARASYFAKQDFGSSAISSETMTALATLAERTKEHLDLPLTNSQIAELAIKSFTKDAKLSEQDAKLYQERGRDIQFHQFLENVMIAPLRERLNPKTRAGRPQPNKLNLDSGPRIDSNFEWERESLQPPKGKNATYSEAIQLIRSELEKHNLVSIEGLNLSGVAGVDQAIWSMETKLDKDGRKGWASNVPLHSMVISGYRKVKNAEGKVKDLLLIQNSWGENFQKKYPHEGSFGWVEAKPLLDRTLYAIDSLTSIGIKLEPYKMTREYVRIYQPKLTTKERQDHEQGVRDREALAGFEKHSANIVSGPTPAQIHDMPSQDRKKLYGEEIEWDLFFCARGEKGQQGMWHCEAILATRLKSGVLTQMSFAARSNSAVNPGWNRVKGKLFDNDGDIGVQVSSASPISINENK